MRHTIPTRNWTSALTDKIQSAQDGNTIIVHSTAMQKMAERAQKRMCPNKKLIFEIQAPEIE